MQDPINCEVQTNARDAKMLAHECLSQSNSGLVVFRLSFYLFPTEKLSSTYSADLVLTSYFLPHLLKIL